MAANGPTYPTAPDGAQLVFTPPEGQTYPTPTQGWNNWRTAVVDGESIQPQAGLK